MSQSIIIDANRIFSWLIAGNHQLRRVMFHQPGLKFFCPKYVLVELFKHKERISGASGLDEIELLTLLHSCLELIHFFDEEAISIGAWTEAWRLCGDVDENDVAYVALALELKGSLWTSDQKLEAGLRRKGFVTFFSTS